MTSAPRSILIRREKTSSLDALRTAFALDPKAPEIISPGIFPSGIPMRGNSTLLHPVARESFPVDRTISRTRKPLLEKIF
jgi:hypothetical protein